MSAIDRAAAALAQAEALLIAAGAGMGVDSGLPDFRGKEGFWRAYPRFRQLGLDFESIAAPRWFDEDPTLAWGFYGHRLNLYRATAPHEGFGILRRWGAEKRWGAFVLTSNVDGQFQKAGFDPEAVWEVHGSIHHAQCVARCGAALFPAPERVGVDEAEVRASEPLPACPRCGGLARPNILMFDDFDWMPSRSDAQRERFQAWLGKLGRGRLAIVEIGAGTAVATVRSLSERLGRAPGATLIRINPREPEVAAGQIGIRGGALAALRQIEARLAGPGSGGEHPEDRYEGGRE